VQASGWRWQRFGEGNARETRKGDSKGGRRGKGQQGEPEDRRRRSNVGFAGGRLRNGNPRDWMKTERRKRE
jgi:hypothetical protein